MLSNLSRRCLKKLKTPHIRSFLSEAYKLTDTWNSRLSSPILQKVNLETFYYEIEQKYNNKNAASAIDIDIFVNKVTDDNHFDEIADLLNKLRRTAEATNILDSTGHAFTRNLLTYNQIEMLIQVLDNRVEYGVILDDYAVNLALDTLIKAGKMKEAARIATIQLMQEDFTNPITRTLSLYSCFKFLENPEHFDDLKPPEKPVIAPGTKKPKIEEIKVRVGFLRNPYFDDHFDLRDSQHLVGKTLYYIGKELQSGDLCTNVKLLGLAFYQKYEKASKLLESTKGSQIYKIVVDKIHDALSKVSEEQQNSEGFNAFKISMEQIAQSHKIVEFDLGNHIEELCKKTVAELEGKEIEQQKKVCEFIN